MVRLNKPNRDSSLHPLRTSLRHKTLGTILRRESTTGHRVFDSDVFAHGSRVKPRWDCGYARRELQQREGIFRGVRLALVVRTDASSTNTRRARWIFAFLSGSVSFLHPRLIHIRVIESMAHLRGQWVNDLDGLERDFADPVAGLQKTDKAALRVEDTAAASGIKPLTFPAKR